MFGTMYDSHTIDADGVSVKVTSKDGSQQTIHCDALVGADGVGSKVRQDIGVSLQG